MKMNGITNWLKGCAVVCGMAWCCLSCEHDYLKYDTQMRDALYFVWPDTSYCSFTAGDPVDTMDYKIYVQVMGLPRGSERSYKIEIIDTNTTAVEGVHYKLSENQIFPADTVKAQMHVILYNRGSGIEESTGDTRVPAGEFGGFRRGTRGARWFDVSFDYKDGSRGNARFVDLGRNNLSGTLQ